MKQLFTTRSLLHTSGWLAAGLLGCLSMSCVSPSDEPDEAIVTSNVVAADRLGPSAPPPTALPLHVSSVISGAPNLIVTSATTLDTTALTINGATSPYFVSQGGYAVLFVNALDVGAAVTITGAAPLIIVASDAITIRATIDLHATGTAAGPGAGTAGAGTAGFAFKDIVGNRVSSGGGGGGYGTAGANGGSRLPASAPPGLAGATYGGSASDPLVGGSPGALGGAGLGAGAGGGALQLSSTVSIEIGAVIHAGGGGGTGAADGFGGGGGGGAGGEILLEAPVVVMLDGVLAANGGGGGGGGSFRSGGRLGMDGADGQPTTSPAAGGLSGVPMGDFGGAGAAGTSASFSQAVAGSGSNSLAGGGGGGAGRIFVRYPSASSPTLITSISPPPSLDSTLTWTPPPINPCYTADTTWINRAVAAQSASFHLELDATPSVTGLDAVIGLTNVVADEFNDLAPTIRFNPAGVIDVRNNAAYAAVVSYPWSPGTSYHFLLTFNMTPTQPTYTVDVLTGSGSYTRLATNYKFRGQQLALHRLANLATKIDAPAGGTLQVCAAQPY